MNPAYERIAARAGNRCEYCHAPEQAFNFPFEVEHIQPKSKGGSDRDENLALACRSCNLHKGNRTQATDPENQQETRLFNPRTDNWDNSRKRECRVENLECRIESRESHPASPC